MGVFAGIGGFELGFERGGHGTVLLCEKDEGARAVLDKQFPDCEKHGSIGTLRNLPKHVDVLVAGFPCQDLSQAGQTAGINGEHSGLIQHVFRLLRRREIPWVVLENVPFMLHLRRGRALAWICEQLERLGYFWAYREIDARAFGLPQRRRRVFFVASLDGDPRAVLLSDDAGQPTDANDDGDMACGFYWTEGNHGIGWAVDAVPPLKGGSTIGIPSPPGILLPTNEVIMAGIGDAERLQGFPVGWTRAAADVVRATYRWKLVGNAVNVKVSEWIGRRLVVPVPFREADCAPLMKRAPWPRAAWSMGDGRFRSVASTWPVHHQQKHLHAFLLDSEKPLSLRAATGFLTRLDASSLNVPRRLRRGLRTHIAQLERNGR